VSAGHNASAAIVIERRGATQADRRCIVEARAWRRVIGAFQLEVPVQARHSCSPARAPARAPPWIDEAIPQQSRWHPVSVAISSDGGTVTSFAAIETIEPSPYVAAADGHRPPDQHERRRAETGKITG